MSELERNFPTLELTSRRNNYFEVLLENSLFENILPEKVLSETIKRGFTLEDLQVDPVIVGEWKSTDESVKPNPILYFKKIDGSQTLLMRGPYDEKFHLWTYRWLP